MRSLSIAVIGMVLLTSGRVERVRADAPKPDDEIRRMCDFYKQLKSFSVHADMDAQVHAGEMNNKMKGGADIVFERPNRLALRGKGQQLGAATVVCDGKTLYTLFGPLKRYTKRDAPKSLAELTQDPIIGSVQGTGTFAIQFLADDPAKSILKGVVTSKDLGTAKIDGRSARHLQFAQSDEIEWQAWIAEGKEPLLLRVEIDLSKMVKKSAGAAFKGKEVKVTMIQSFKDWKLNVKPSPGDFTFTPPQEAKEVQSLFGRDEEEEEAPSPLLGKAAPPVDLERLDGKRVKLADHAGKDVVMLDMWATWCGPCRAELPILLEVAKEYKSKGVSLYGINQREDKKTIDKFLKKEKYDLTVGLDEEGKVGDAYGAEGIPLLAIVDKKGIVQSIHVGYSPEIKKTLHKELDAILAGKNIAAATLAEFQAKKKKKNEAKSQVATLNGLERAWSNDGPYSSAAYDQQSQSIFALKQGGQCDVLSPDGKIRRSFKVKAEGSLLRLAKTGRTGNPNLLVFGVWSAPLSACASSDGSLLWTYKNDDGVDDVWPADIDGDGRDEVIVGLNGSGGLRVLDPDGVLRWKTTEIGNVWHVAAGDLNGNKKIEIVSTSAEGKVHVFDAEGKSLATFDPPFYSDGVRVGPLSKSDTADTIVATSSDSIAALNGKGKVLWSHSLPAGINHLDSMAICPTRPWVVCGCRGGKVVVIDCAAEGKAIADTAGAKMFVDATWAIGDDHETPVVLVSDGRALSAFRVKPQAATGTEKDKEKAASAAH
jgi:peroxiredoxin/outer membrane protein assembly factor BamB